MIVVEALYVCVCLCDAIPRSLACSYAENRYQNFELYHLMRGTEIQTNNIEFGTTLDGYVIISKENLFKAPFLFLSKIKFHSL